MSNNDCTPCQEEELIFNSTTPPECEETEPCANLSYDNCVIYTGPNLPHLGVTTGMRQSEVTALIASALFESGIPGCPTISDLALTIVDGEINLNWTPAPRNVLTQKIYRKNTVAGSYAEIGIGALTTTSSTFIDLTAEGNIDYTYKIVTGCANVPATLSDSNEPTIHNYRCNREANMNITPTDTVVDFDLVAIEAPSSYVSLKVFTAADVLVQDLTGSIDPNNAYHANVTGLTAETAYYIEVVLLNDGVNITCTYAFTTTAA